MDRKELQDLSRIRLKEAQSLLSLGMADGAFYLAGYAVECALKACIAKGTRRGEFPDKKRAESSHSHNLVQLCRVAGLERAIETHSATDPIFAENWDRLQSWSEQARYARHRLDSAKALLEAAGDRSHGVLSWIRKRW